MLGLCTWQCSPEHRRPRGALGHAGHSSSTQTPFAWGLRAEGAGLPLLSAATVPGPRFEAWVPPMLRGKRSGRTEVSVQSPSASCPQPRSRAVGGPWARLPSARTPNTSVTQIANLFSAIWQRSFYFCCSWSPSPPTAELPLSTAFRTVPQGAAAFPAERAACRGTRSWPRGSCLGPWDALFVPGLGQSRRACQIRDPAGQLQ